VEDDLRQTPLDNEKAYDALIITGKAVFYAETAKERFAMGGRPVKKTTIAAVAGIAVR
jgi:hypothetical protein